MAQRGAFEVGFGGGLQVEQRAQHAGITIDGEQLAEALAQARDGGVEEVAVQRAVAGGLELPQHAQQVVALAGCQGHIQRHGRGVEAHLALFVGHEQAVGAEVHDRVAKQAAEALATHLDGAVHRDGEPGIELGRGRQRHQLAVPAVRIGRAQGRQFRQAQSAVAIAVLHGQAATHHQAQVDVFHAHAAQSGHRQGGLQIGHTQAGAHVKAVDAQVGVERACVRQGHVEQAGDGLVAQAQQQAQVEVQRQDAASIGGARQLHRGQHGGHRGGQVFAAEGKVGVETAVEVGLQVQAQVDLLAAELQAAREREGRAGRARGEDVFDHHRVQIGHEGGVGGPAGGQTAEGVVERAQGRGHGAQGIGQVHAQQRGAIEVDAAERGAFEPGERQVDP